MWMENHRISFQCFIGTCIGNKEPSVSKYFMLDEENISEDENQEQGKVSWWKE